MYYIMRRQHTHKSSRVFGSNSSMMPFVTIWKGEKLPFDIANITEEHLKSILLTTFLKPGHYLVKHKNNTLFNVRVEVTDLIE